MLDDLKYIHTKDAQDALGIAAKQPEQLLHDFKVTSPKGPFANVVYAGMGGSALAVVTVATPKKLYRRLQRPKKPKLPL